MPHPQLGVYDGLTARIALRDKFECLYIAVYNFLSSFAPLTESL